MFNLSTCPECGHCASLDQFIQDTNPPAGNSGSWCPVCEISLELQNDHRRPSSRPRPMRRYNARFEFDTNGNQIHVARKNGKWVRHEDIEPTITAAKRLLALVEAVAEDLDPEYGPDAELPGLKATISSS